VILYTRRHSPRAPLAAALVVSALALFTIHAQTLAPIVYTIRFPDPASNTFTIDMTVPTDKRDSVDLMMAIWSPGFYGLQNYARNVSGFTATTTDGAPLDVTKPNDSRWTVATHGLPSFHVTYTLAAPRGSNLSNGVTDTSAVITARASHRPGSSAANRAGRAEISVRTRREDQGQIGAWTGTARRGVGSAPAVEEDGRPTAVNELVSIRLAGWPPCHD
jgi:hypothetical protein